MILIFSRHAVYDFFSICIYVEIEEEWIYQMDKVIFISEVIRNVSIAKMIRHFYIKLFLYLLQIIICTTFLIQVNNLLRLSHG